MSSSIVIASPVLVILNCISSRVSPTLRAQPHTEPLAATTVPVARKLEPSLGGRAGGWRWRIEPVVAAPRDHEQRGGCKSAVLFSGPREPACRLESVVVRHTPRLHLLRHPRRILVGPELFARLAIDQRRDAFLRRHLPRPLQRRQEVLGLRDVLASRAQTLRPPCRSAGSPGTDTCGATAASAFRTATRPTRCCCRRSSTTGILYLPRVSISIPE